MRIGNAMRSLLMYSVLYLAAIVVCLLVAGHCGRRASKAGTATTSAISPKDDVIRLFDGKTLGDCYTWLKDTKREDPRKVFSVADGMIHVSGDGLGGLVTNKRYRDYHLVVEFKFGERTWHDRENAARDSGLLVHSNGKDGGYEGTWMPSIEVQIIEGGVGDFVAGAAAPDESGKPVPISLHLQRRAAIAIERSRLESRTASARLSSAAI